MDRIYLRNLLVDVVMMMADKVGGLLFEVGKRGNFDLIWFLSVRVLGFGGMHLLFKYAMQWY